MQIKTITEQLNLPNFKVVSILEQNESSIHLSIDLIESVAPVCLAVDVKEDVAFFMKRFV